MEDGHLHLQFGVRLEAVTPEGRHGAEGRAAVGDSALLRFRFITVISFVLIRGQFRVIHELIPVFQKGLVRL